MNESIVTAMNISTTNNTFCNIHGDSPTTRTVKVIAIFLVGGFGVIGNFLIIVLALKFTVRRNLHHLIINMAVADTLVVFMAFVHDIPPLLNYKYFFLNTNVETLNEILCRVLICLRHASRLVSLVTLLIISIERFRATRPTFQILQPSTLKRRLAIIACSWVIPLPLTAFGLFASLKKKGTEIVCFAPEFLIWKNIQTCFVMIAFFVILILSVISLRKLTHPQAIQAHLSVAQGQTRVKRTSRAVKMVLCSLILYSCYYPLFIYKVVFKLILSEDRKKIRQSTCIDWDALTYVLRFLPLVNSCFSPCVYIAFLSDFREAAKRMLCGCLNGRNSVQVQTTEMTKKITDKNTARSK